MTDPAGTFDAVYHVAVMNHWQSVVREQIPVLLSNRHLHQLVVTVAVEQSDRVADAAAWIESLVRITAGGQTLKVTYYGCRLDQFEHPAIGLVDALAAKDDRAVLYFHTKGVSQPPQQWLQAWRQLLNRFIAQGDHWAEFLAANTEVDACGPLLMRDLNHGYTYFAGNFWMARAAYLRELPSYDVFVEHPPAPRFAPMQRHLAEIAVNRTARMKPLAIDGTAFTTDGTGESFAPFFQYLLAPQAE